MRCKTNNLTVVDPFQAIRGEFAKQFGVPANARLGARVTESERDVVLSLALPGVQLDDLDVTVEDGNLTISGVRRTPEFEDGRELFSSLAVGEFRRTFRLHDSLDADSIDAVMDQGVLTLTVSKLPERQPRAITVRSASQS